MIGNSMTVFAELPITPKPKTRERTMTAPHKLNAIYGSWFSDLIADRISGTGLSSPNAETPSVYFLTLTFQNTGDSRRRRLAEGQRDGKSEMDAFHHFYNRVCRKLIGRNYHRAIHADRLPTAIPFLDVEGSKFWGSIGEMANVHIHSLWVIEDDIAPAFEAMFDPSDFETSSFLGELGFDGVDVQKIEASDLHRISKVTGYASKLIGFNNAALELSEDFRVYPISS